MLPASAVIDLERVLRALAGRPLIISARSALAYSMMVDGPMTWRGAIVRAFVEALRRFAARMLEHGGSLGDGESVAHWNEPPQRHLSAPTESEPANSKAAGNAIPALPFERHRGLSGRKIGMDLDTWTALTKHQLRYRDLLVKRMDDWRREHIGSCADIAALQNFIRLTERVERNERRIRKHGAKMLAVADIRPAARH